MRGSEIGYGPAKWIIQKRWYYTSSVLIWSQNASCILLYLVTQWADGERQQLSPFKYYPTHAERCISIFNNKINTKQIAAYVRLVVWMLGREEMDLADVIHTVNYFRLLLVSVVWNTLEADMRFSMYCPRTWFSDLSLRFSSFTASTRAERSNENRQKALECIT